MFAAVLFKVQRRTCIQVLPVILPTGIGAGVPMTYEQHRNDANRTSGVAARCRSPTLMWYNGKD